MIKITSKRIKRLLFLIVSFFLIFLLTACCTTRYMSYGEISNFTDSQLDSCLYVRGLPNISRWKSMVYILSEGEPFYQYVYVEQVDSKKTDESIYTVERRDSLFRFTHKITKKCMD